MSRLHDEVVRARESELKKLPPALRHLAAQGTNGDEAIAEGRAREARLTYLNNRDRLRQIAEAEAQKALAVAKLAEARAALDAAKHRAAFADFGLMKVRSAIEAEEVALRRQLLPPHHIRAARTILRRERDRFERDAPRSTPTNQAAATVKDWTRTAEHMAWVEAAGMVDNALQDLEHFELGLIDAPLDLAEWLDAVCARAEARVRPFGVAS